jgi:hypothetical protein
MHVSGFPFAGQHYDQDAGDKGDGADLQTEPPKVDQF